MGKRKYGDIVTGATGSLNKQLGGITSLKNGVTRVRVIPANPQTALQQELRGAFALLTTAWSGTLSEANRDAWETARTGNAYYLKQDSFTGVSRPYASAKDLFIAMNLNLMYANNGEFTGGVQINVPTAPTGADGISVTSVVADDSSNSVIATYTGVFSNEAGIFRATPVVSPGTMRTTSVVSKMRNVALVTASPDTIADYITQFGALTGLTGSKIFWEIIGVDLGSGKQRLISAGQSIIVA